MDGGHWEQRSREVRRVCFGGGNIVLSLPAEEKEQIERGSLERKGREGMGLNKVSEEAEDLESRSWTESRTQVERLVLDRSRGPSLAEHDEGGTGEVPEPP